MEQLIAAPSGTYLYGVVAADQVVEEAELSGIDGGCVHYVIEGALAAAVSGVPDEKLRPQRRHLAAHQAVLMHLMGKSGLLPMSFGNIAKNTKDVCKLLSANQDALLEQLERVAGNVEMGLRVCWNVPNFFEYFVSRHPNIASLRDRMFSGGREPSQGDKLELGRLFEKALNTDRDEHTETVKRFLLPCCVEILENDPREDRDVLSLACLVASDRQKDFENAVMDAAKLFDDTFSFDFSGPWPPYNFVEMQLSM
jgi:hypothetical protein